MSKKAMKMAAIKRACYKKGFLCIEDARKEGWCLAWDINNGYYLV